MQFNHYRRRVRFQNDKAEIEIPNVNGWDIIANSEPCSVSCCNSIFIVENFLHFSYQFECEDIEDVHEWDKEMAHSKDNYPPRYIFTLTPNENAASCKFQLLLVGMTDEILKFSFELHCTRKPYTLKQRGMYFTNFLMSV